MNRWKLTVPAALTLCVILPLASCADFFTNSWGKALVRDPSTITVSKGNVKDLLKEAKGDTTASKGILDKIAEKLKGNPNPDPELQRAAITAANQASGLGQLVLENVNTLTDALSSSNTDTNVIEDLLGTIEKEAGKNKIPEVADTIAEVLKPAIDPTGVPKFKDDIAIKEVPTSELLLLTTTMILAESGTFEEYANSWTATGKKLDGKGTALDPNERLIAALVNEIADRTELGGDFKKIFEGGN